MLHRHYPASSLVRASPPPLTAQPVPRGLLVGSFDLPPCWVSRVAAGLRCVHVLTNTPAIRTQCSLRSLAAPCQPFPVFKSGRRSHCPFRGLLGVHGAQMFGYCRSSLRDEEGQILAALGLLVGASGPARSLRLRGLAGRRPAPHPVEMRIAGRDGFPELTISRR